MVGHWNLQWNL